MLKSLLSSHLLLCLTALGSAQPRNLMLNLPPSQVARVSQTLGIAITREDLVDLIQDRLIHDFGWTGLVYVGDAYLQGAALYQPTPQFFQLNGVFSFEELVADGRRVGGLSSGHIGRVSIPELRRVVAAKNLDGEATRVLLANMVLHEWIGHGVSDSSAFHGTPPMGPSIRAMLPGFATQIMHFQDNNQADHQIYRKIRMQLACP